MEKSHSHKEKNENKKQEKNKKISESLSESVSEEPILPQKKETSETTEEVVEEKGVKAGEEDLLLLEDDDLLSSTEEGNFFWLLKKIIWAILKGGIAMGVVLFFLWFVWFSEKKSSPKIPIQIKTQTETIKILKPSEQKTKKEKNKEVVRFPSSQAQILATEMVAWAESIELKRQKKLQDTFSRSMFWIRKAKSFYDIPLNKISWGDTVSKREQNINAFLFRLYEMIAESAKLRKFLAQEVQYLNQKNSFILGEIQPLEQQITTNFSLWDAEQTMLLIKTKTEKEKLLPENKNKQEVYRWVLQTMEGYDKVLRTIYENVFANKDALIQNIQVVYFPEDPFKRVITPAEWKNKK